MLRQGPVGKAESPHGAFFIDNVDDLTGIQRIESEVMYGNRYLGSDQYGGSRPMEVYPRHAEHFPCSDRFHGPLPRIFAFAKLHATTS
jgi:hypothetical protein